MAVAAGAERTDQRVRARLLLRRDRDFRRLWLGESLSALGSQVTLLALPLVAVTGLSATPAQMGLLGAAHTVPFLLLAVFAGVWIDRSRKRPILVTTHLVKALALALIPLLALTGTLRMTHLLLIAFVIGSCTVLFEIAYQSYLPVLVDRDDLVEANGTLSASTSVAEVAGPGLAGLLIGALTAPVAVLIDSASFLFSARWITGIRRSEPHTRPVPSSISSLRQDVVEGFRFTVRDRYLRAFAGEAATYNIAWNALDALLVLWAVRELGLSTTTLGLLLSIGSIGAVAGALLATRSARRFGVGRTMWVSAVISNLGVLLIPLASGTPAAVVVVLTAAFVLRGLGMTGTNVHTYAIRQAVTPPDMLGRTNAAYRVLTYGFIPLGALAGGVLGQTVGLHTAILISALLLFPSWLWLFFSPARTLRGLPGTDTDAGDDLQQQGRVDAPQESP